MPTSSPFTDITARLSRVIEHHDETSGTGRWLPRTAVTDCGEFRAEAGASVNLGLSGLEPGVTYSFRIGATGSLRAVTYAPAAILDAAQNQEPTS